MIIENRFKADSYNVLCGGGIWLKDIRKVFAEDLRKCIVEKRVPEWLIFK